MEANARCSPEDEAQVRSLLPEARLEKRRLKYAQACVQRLSVTVAEVGVAMLADQACAAHHMEQYV